MSYVLQNHVNSLWLQRFGYCLWQKFGTYLHKTYLCRTAFTKNVWQTFAKHIYSLQTFYKYMSQMFATNICQSFVSLQTFYKYMSQMFVTNVYHKHLPNICSHKPFINFYQTFDKNYLSCITKHMLCKHFTNCKI